MKGRSSRPQGPADAGPGALANSPMSLAAALRLGLGVAVDAVSSEDWDAILKGLGVGIRELFQVEEVQFGLLDGGGNGFRVRRIRGLDGVEPAEDWVPCEEGNPLGWVGIHRRTLWRNDLETDLRFPTPEGSVEVGSEILAPLIRQERCFGVLGCRADRRRAFRREDVEVMHSFAVLASLALERVNRFREVRQQALLDALTGVLNRGSLEQYLEKELERSRRYRRPLALLLMDLDDFKRINDTHGHAAGDRVLVRLARLVEGQIRRFDILGRFGGEEFVVLLPETSLKGAEGAAEKLRKMISRADILRGPDGVPWKVTVSIGIAGFPGSARTPADLLRAADQALYRAKALGKNRAVVSSENP